MTGDRPGELTGYAKMGGLEKIDYRDHTKKHTA